MAATGRYISLELADAIHSYLLTRPAQEVLDMIILLRQSKPCREPGVRKNDTTPC